MDLDERNEVAAAVAAHGELGPRYDAEIAEGLVERIGSEIDRRVEARLREPASRSAALRESALPGAAPRRNLGISGAFLGLGSMGMAIGATAVVLHNASNGFAQFLMVALIWTAIAAVNVAHARRVF